MPIHLTELISKKKVSYNSVIIRLRLFIKKKLYISFYPKIIYTLILAKTFFAIITNFFLFCFIVIIISTFLPINTSLF